jgi:hypothetical protein
MKFAPDRIKQNGLGLLQLRKYTLEGSKNSRSCTVKKRPISKTILAIFCILLLSQNLWAQSAGDYRTIDAGGILQWNDLNDWQRYNGSTWLAPTVSEGYPGFSDSPTLVTIRTLNSPIVTLNVQPVYAIGGLVISSGGSLSMSNDLTVTGNVTVDGTLSPGSQTIYFDAAATFTIGTSGIFTMGTSTLSFAANGAYIIQTDNTSNIDFFNINYVPATGVTNSLTFQEESSGSPTFRINGTFTRGQRSNSVVKDTDATLSYVNGTLKYTNNQNFTVGDEWPSTNPPQTVDISTIGATTVTNLGKIVDTDNFILKSGEFDINGSGRLSIDTELEIQGGTLDNNGTLTYEDGSTLKYNAASEYDVGSEWDGPVNVEITGSGADLTTNYSSTTMSIGPGGSGDGDITFTAILKHDATLQVYGDVVGGSGNFGVADNGTLALTGSNDANVDLSNTFRVRNLTVNKTASGSATLLSGATLQLDANSSSSLFLVQTGTFEFAVTSTALQLLNGGTHSLQINSGATLETGGKDITGLTISAASGTIVFDGIAIETLPTNLTIGTVQVNNSVGVNAATGLLTINTQLNLVNGAVNTSSSNAIKLDLDATIAGSSYVDGPLQKEFNDANDTFLFPVGTSARRSATFEYTESTSGWSGTSIIEVEHSTTGFTVTKTLPGGISEIDQSSHYIVREVGSAPTTIDYTFTGTFEEGNFTPETRNRILVEAGTAYTEDAAIVDADVNTGSNTIYGTFNALPVGSRFIVFGGTTQTEVVWDGSTNNSWSENTNWDTGNAPTSTDFVTIDISATVVISGSADCATLALGDGSIATQLTIGSGGSLAIHETSGTPLVVENNATLIINISTDPAIDFNPTGPATYYPARTNFMAGSEVQYLAGNVQADNYSDLVINGASTTTGSGTVDVGDDLTVSSAFTVNNPITLSGINSTYNHTAGIVDYTSTLTVNGLQFNLSGGTIDGTVVINVPNISVNGGNFDYTSSLVTFGGSSSQSLNATTDPDFYDLTINKAANNLTLGGATTVSGTLTLTQGLINTSSGLLTLDASTASVSGGSASSFINGPVAWDGTGSNLVFPVGKNTNYRPVELVSLSGTNPIVQFEMFDNNPQGLAGSGLTNISLVRYWQGSLNSGSSPVFQLKLTWGSDDGVDGQLSNLRVATSTASNGTYTSAGNTASSGDGSGGTVTSNTGLTALQYLTLGDANNDNSLPVELAAFTAEAGYSDIKLNWTTASELENFGFNIYRSVKDEDNWSKVNAYMIPGQGNTSQRTDYEYIDNSVAGGYTYEYMLESISYAGVRVQEKVIEVFVPIPTEYTTLGNYPNPFNPTTNIGFRLPETSEVSILIYGIQGNLVKELALNQAFEAGDHFVTWDATDNSGQQVASGMYVYLFTAGNFKKTEKMLLLK